MAADDGDPFEQGKLARFNNEPHDIPILKIPNSISAGRPGTGLSRRD